MMSMELSDYKRSLEKTKEQLRSVEEDNLRKDEHLKELTNKFVTATEERDNALQELEKSKRELADLKTMLDGMDFQKCYIHKFVRNFCNIFSSQKIKIL